MASGILEIFAPLAGVIWPLESVPDPVFAQKTVGPGLAIDPLSETLLAPVAGVITQLHKSHHALTILSESGAEVLIHVGLDTVQLRGEGFSPLVKIGDAVKVGTPLLKFNADLVARKAKSLLTLIVIANGDASAMPEVLVKGSAKEGERLATFSLDKLRLPSKGAAATLGDWLSSKPILITTDAGLHARPAAELAAAAKKFKSEARIGKGGSYANLRSLSAVMSLEVGERETITLETKGADAKEMLAALEKILQVPAAAAPLANSGKAARAPEKPKKAAPAEDGSLRGVMASPGSTAGVIHQLRGEEAKLEEKGEGAAKELPKLEAALSAAAADLQNLSQGKKKDTAATIFGAHLELLDDPELAEQAKAGIEKGQSAAFAWRTAYEQVAKQLAGLNNQLLAARSTDVRDVGRRVERKILGINEGPQKFPEGAILVAEDLAPSDVAGLDRNLVHGLCTTTGGATSHVAILARSLDLPALVGLDESLLSIPNGAAVILDANQGVLRLNPSEAERNALKETETRRAAKKAEDLKNANLPAATCDGHRVEIVANVKGAADAKTSVGLGGEGVGLLRTEFLFLGRNEAPSEKEQEDAYRAIAQAVGPDRTLVIRTLDVGGDKPLPYLPLPKEENPFLGERGIRVSLRHPESFRTQLRAVLRIAKESKVHLMFPMVAGLHELREAKKILEEERRAINAPAIPVGVMIEVPSAALLAEHFAKEADFFSIGSNDLAQYTLAIDRGHPKLASEVDGLDPSLLHLISITVKAAHAHKRWVGVCGGIAGDPQAVPILIGLGVDELSVSVPAIPAVKAQVRSLTLKDCQSLAQKALTLGTAAEVRALVPLTE